MQNLFFRNRFVFGVLMVCVLMVGVQGVADALTFQTRTSGDLITVSPNQPFKITFYPQPKSPVAQFSGTTTGSRAAYDKADVSPTATVLGFTNIKTATGLTENNPGDYYYYDRTSPDTIVNNVVTEKGTTTRTWLSESDAYYYNDEAITINSNGIILTRSGNTLPALDGTTNVLVDRHGDSHRRLASSITLDGSHVTPEKYNIVITDSSPSEDFPPEAPPATTRDAITFTIFVVGRATSTTPAADWQLSGLTNGYNVGGNDFDDDLITTAADTHVRVEYTVVKGSGRLYVKEGTRKGTAARTFSTSSAAAVYLDMNGTTNEVRASIPVAAPQTGLFIFGHPVLTKVSGDLQDGVFGGRLDDPLVVSVKDGKNRAIPGLAVVFSPTTETPATARFIPVLGTTVYTDPDTAALVGTPGLTTETADISHAPAAAIVVQTDSRGEAKTYFQLNTAPDPITIDARRPKVTVMAGGSQLLSHFRFDAGVGTRKPVLRIFSGNNQRTDENGELEHPLVVVVTQGGNLLPRQEVTFRTKKGTLVGRNEDDDGPNTNPKRAYATTNSSGEARVWYEQDPDSGSDTVTAEISGSNYEKEVTFNINGRASTPTPTPTPTPTNRITITLSETTGEPGDEIDVRITSNPSGRSVTIDSGELDDDDFSRLSGITPFTRTLILPDEEDTYDFSAGGTGLTTARASVTVETEEEELGTLSISGETSGAPGTQITVAVTATDADGDREGRLDFTVSGTSILTKTGQTASNGTGRVIVGLPSTIGTYRLVAKATGYTDRPFNVTVRTARQPTDTGDDDEDEEEEEETPTVSEPADITIVGPSTRTEAVINTQLEAALIVQVLDDDDDPVADSRVIFRVKTGKGRLQEKGNGRAIAVQTDTRGYARADYTPQSATSTVEAEARGVTKKVTFTITTDGSAPAATGTAGAARTYKTGDPIPLSTGSTLNFSGSRTVNGSTYTCVGPGECVVSYGLVAKGEIRSAAVPTVQAKVYKVGQEIPISLNDTLTFTSSHTVQGTTYTCVGPGECVVSHGLVAKGEIRVAAKTGDTPRTTAIDPVVHVAAAQRPSMVWVDGGAIYSLVGASPQRFAPGVDNAVNITVGGGKVYWTEQTGESGGTINSANLNGTSVKELASIQAVPMGIAVDTAGSKLYWTNSRGRIQSANLDGSRITNVMQNLEGVMDLALAGGNAYWTQGGNVRFVNLRGQKQIRNVSTGTDTAGSLAIGGGKVYWTEQTGDSGGTVNSANLNGSGARQLASILATPTGIAVDGSRSKLYWGNARGRIQAANLDGSKIQNVVDGLGSPGDMVISNSLKAPAGTTTAPKTTTAANKYDVNGDGSVDSMDVDALVVAVSAGITDAKYDVNADGKVDINDVVAVSANRSAGAAGAPTLIGNIKLSAIQIDRLQEQIELLIATGDRSPAAMKTLIYLQQLIALARPEQTQLFANYPNPFNPETWMPYELATDTNVKITIYNPQGVVIRTLVLGHQSAGYYTDRERAAYWDGKNALGEQVASGVYFYQLETDAMSMMRKMVILK